MMTAKSQQFLNELALFYRNKGQHNVTSDNLIVRLNGKPVNLCELYSSVLEMGGSYKVNQYNRWDEIYLKLFKPQPLGANVSVALRQIYMKYLLAYEKVNFSNFISDTLDNDDDEGTNKEINSNFSFLSNNQVAHYHRQNDLSNTNPLNKLFCCLMSDLPNEMDFGLREATILTNSEKIDNLADFKFIDVIVECCILYICSCESNAYSKSSDYPFEEEHLISLLNREDVKNLLAEHEQRHRDEGTIIDQQKENQCDRVVESKSVSSKFTVNNIRKFRPFKDCHCFVKFWCQMMKHDQDLVRFIFDLTDEELNELYEENYCQEEHQKNLYKLKRIVCLLKNISYSIEKLRQEQATYELDDYDQIFGGLLDNASINLLRFFILLLNSDEQFLVNIALEIISNVSPLVNNSSNSLPGSETTYIRLLTTIYDWCVQRVLTSNDVNCLNRCLEILAKLINSNHLAINRLIISEVFNQTAFFFNRLTELLTCQHDVGVVVSALECCLTLSENYPKLLLTDNKHLIKMLINLINCEEGQYFTLSSIKKVKIIDERKVEFHPHLQLTQQSQQMQFHPQQQTILIQQPMNQVTQKAIQLNDLNNSAILADNEQHVKCWFYANFEPRPMNTTSATANKTILKLNEMYGDYVKHSYVNGRRNVVTSQTFANLLKKYFPSVLINQNEVNGLGAKTNVNRINNTISIVQQPTSTLQITTNSAVVTNSGNPLTSPILKAHLSTPPKANAVAATTTTNLLKLFPTPQAQASNQIGNPSIMNSSNQQQFQMNGPITTTTSTASPLIKNLLANKLRNNQNTSNSNNLDDSKSNSSIISTNFIQQPNITLVTNQQANVSSGNIIFATNSTITSTASTLPNGSSGPNLITVPLQQQHIVPVSSSNSSMIINTNQFTSSSGTMVMQPTAAGGQQQFLLVRTIMPQQNNTTNLIAGSTTSNQQPMRLILPASVLTSQSPQTITINGAPNSTQTIITQPQPTQQQQQQQSSPVLTTITTEKVAPQSNEVEAQSNEKDKLLKACLGSSNVSSSPSIVTSNNVITNNIASETVVTNPITVPVSNSVTKSSPLLNVLLDKGKLPEFSTVSNDTNAQDKLVAAVSTSSQLTTTQHPSNLTTTTAPSNHIITNQSSSTSVLTNTTNASTIASTLACPTATQIITSTVNTNPTKMYILTTTKSPLTIKNGNSVQTTSSSTPIQSFIIQQPNTTTAGIVSQPQYIIQQQPQGASTTIVNSNLVSQPLIVHQQQPSISTVQSLPPSTLLTTTTTSTNRKEQKPVELSNSLPNDVEQQLSSKPMNELPNCVVKKENGAVSESEIEKTDTIKKSVNSEEMNKEKAPVLTNGCLEKENVLNDCEMEVDNAGDKEITKNSLLKRQLESDDSLCKRAKSEAQITPTVVASVPVSTAKIKQEPVLNKTVVVNNKPSSEIKSAPQQITAIVVSSNGILPTQPTISNTIIKTALNSPIPLAKTNLTATVTSTSCTIADKITVAKPNMIIQKNTSENKIASPQIVTANSGFKVIATSVQAPIPAATPIVQSKVQYICEWSNCKKSFEKPQSVFLHVHKDHVIPLDEKPIKCSWGIPEGTGPGCKSLRPKYSLLTHLQDFHCDVHQLQQAAKRKQQLMTKGVTDVPQICPPAHPGYANNAAFMAIKRHSNLNIIESRPVANISPLSKSVRLTAAMILRNLAQHSNSIKRLLKNYESYLSELCIFDNREDSRTLAQCLAIITQERN